MALKQLRQSRMMAHLLDALEEGKDVGHYGRLVFAMVARHFMDDDELVKHLRRNLEENEARALVLQVRERGYSPPRRAQVLEWQTQQDFPICPDADDPDGCNVYKELKFPDEVYERIDEYYEEKAAT